VDPEETPRAIPQGPAGALLMGGSQLPDFLSPRPLARFLGIMLALSALVAWLAVGVHLADVLERRAEIVNGMRDLDRQSLVSSTLIIVHRIEAVVFMLTGGALLGWLWRLRVNARAMAVRRFTYPRSWTVLGFFVPGLNVLRPYQVMAEIWQASDPAVVDPFEWKTLATPRILAIWWLTFVGAATLQVIAIGLGWSAGVVPFRAMVASGFGGLADAAAGACASLGFFVVARLTSLQIAKGERVLGMVDDE
jgi:hypothetical protein